MDTSALEPRHRFEQEEDPEEDEEESRQVREVVIPSKQIPSHLDKNQAFMEYKNTIGKEKEDMLASDKNELRNKKSESKAMTIGLNQIKKDIDIKTREINAIRENKQTEEDIIDEEEFAIIRDLKDLKRAYREKHSVLSSVKDDAQMITNNIDNCKGNMVNEFETWLLEKYGEVPGHVTENKHEVSRTTDGNVEEDEDLDAIAYIKAKRNVSTLHKAKKQMMSIKHK
jgi:hypothetical protein